MTPARRRARVWTTLLTVGSVVLVVILLLVALGYLVKPAATPAGVTVTEVQVTILQHNISSGITGWFGPDHFVEGQDSGYPVEVPAGGSFVFPWAAVNYDTVNHTIYSVSVNAPFTLLRCLPALPALMYPGDDDSPFGFTIQVPDSAGSSYVVNLTVDALGPVS